MSRVYNFNPGPGTLPLAVLEQAQAELLDYQGTGMSVMELSHRSKEFEAIITEAEERFKRLAGVGDDYRVLFVQGGASQQFVNVPLNLLADGKVGNYILTGSWSEKALKEAALLGATHVAASVKESGYTRIPRADEIDLSDNAAYVHITTNNTIKGTQWHTLPDFGDVPLIADASSDILSRPFPAEKFALLYGGAQKNLGPSGVTAVLIRTSLLEAMRSDISIYLRYSTHLEGNSLYNTPPTLAIYFVNLVLGWIESQGGLAGVEAVNQQKAHMVYEAIDNSNGFYTCPIAADSRSLMNVVFRLPSEELEAAFLTAAKREHLVGLKGHRSVGGMRASLYNAMTVEGVQTLVDVMQQFAAQHA